MKMVTVRPDQAQLTKLIAQVYEGRPVVLSYRGKKVSVQRYESESTGPRMDIDQDRSDLEAELLKAVKGPFKPYTQADLVAIVERVHRAKA